MKKWAVLGLGSLMSLAAVADNSGPSWYGQISKEVRYVDQKDLNPIRSQYTGSTDVDDYSAWIGVKGEIDTKGSIHVMYNAELGTESNLDNTTGSGTATRANEKIEVRRSNIAFKGNYGTVKIGKDWQWHATRLMAADPFNQSGARTSAQNLTNIIGFTRAVVGVGADGINGLGLIHRDRMDQLSYHSLDWSGFQFDVTIDRNQNSNLNQTLTTNTTWYTTTAAYDHDFGGAKLGLTAVYAFQDQYATPGKNSTAYWQTAATLGVNAWDFSLGWGNAGYKNAAGAKDKDDTMFASVAYKYEDWKFAMSYSLLDSEDKSATGGTATDMSGKYTAWNFGAMYALTQNVSLRGIIQFAKADLDGAIADLDATTAALDKKNTATSIMFGATVNF